jgi:hypothetical protein
MRAGVLPPPSTLTLVSKGQGGKGRQLPPLAARICQNLVAVISYSAFAGYLEHCAKQRNKRLIQYLNVIAIIFFSVE